MTVWKDMAGSIPPTELFRDTISTEASCPETFSPQPSTGTDITMAMEGVNRRSGMTWVAAIIWAIIALAMGFFAVSQGAPGFFLLIAVLMAVFGIASAAASERQQQRAVEEKAAVELDAQERLRNEIAEAVKDSIKSNIKVRCRYCGSLNDETATKCDSCGATL
jgi:ribosomal protein L40E